MSHWSKNKKIVFAALAAGLVFLFFYFSFQSLSQKSLALVRPMFLAKINFRKGFENLAFLWRSKRSLLAENEALKTKLEEYRRQLVYSDFLQTENEKLKELLNLKDAKIKTILVRVLTKPNLSLYDTILVDLPEAAAAAGGEKVIVPPNILLGEVVEVAGRVAKVKLYSTPAEKTNAILASSPVVLVGRGGGNFKIILPREKTVSLGDVVTFPPNFLIGKVSKIEADPRLPEQTIYVSSPVNIFNLEFVEIIKNGI